MEMFDITDDNGFPTGETVSRSDAHDKGIPHRTAHIWIVRKRAIHIRCSFRSVVLKRNHFL